MPATSNQMASVQTKTPVRRGASQRLAKILREQFSSGKFGPGDRLPTHRKLMEQFDVGYSVANRAMEILVHEGLVERQQGSGSFISKKATANMRASQTDTLALVLGCMDWSFNLSLLQGTGAATGKLHYQKIVCDTKNDVAIQAMLLMELIDKRVAGIALVPTTNPETPDFQIRLCQDCGIPVVLLHRGVKGVSAPLISLPFEEIGFLAGKELVQQGHRHVACLFDEHYIGTEQYQVGLRRALAECGDDKHKLTIYCSGKRALPIALDQEQSFLEEMLEGILAQPVGQRPTAIMAIADDDAEWIYMRLMRMGVRVPDEISLITVGSAMRQREIERHLSAVTIDEMGVGQLSTQLLVEMSKGERPISDNSQFNAEIDFHAGCTLGPVPQAAEQAVKE